MIGNSLLSIQTMLVVTIVSTGVKPAAGQITYDGCQDPPELPVASVPAYQLPNVAQASRANGAPVIYYNPNVLAWFQPVTRLFWYMHECAHHALGHTIGMAFPPIMEQQPTAGPLLRWSGSG